jgi:hypothetical protein
VDGRHRVTRRQAARAPAYAATFRNIGVLSPALAEMAAAFGLDHSQMRAGDSLWRR